MADIRPFQCVRPNEEVAALTAALPYDVYNRAEARAEASKNRVSFLNIDRPETQFEESADMYAPQMYEKAKELYEQQKENGTYIKDTQCCYYIYELIMNGRSQNGIAACACIDDYMNQIIKKHENTREEKEQDRIRHVDALSAQTGPIFLAYRSNPVLHEIVHKQKEQRPLYDFTSEDGITHRVYKVSDTNAITAIQQEFMAMDRIYIADGHHRAASAVKVGLNRRQERCMTKNTSVNVNDSSQENKAESDYFLSVLFPEDELKILPYYRVIKDLNGYSKDSFLCRISQDFTVVSKGKEQVAPMQKGVFGLYLDGCWYELTVKASHLNQTDCVTGLDVSILQDYVLAPLLGIKDPRSDQRIDFVGGIRGLGELERRVADDCVAAFSLYPTSIQELFAVADANRLMPPKSTWFEPKLRSGLMIHEF